jgi:uncharacterized membrane protein
MQYLPVTLPFLVAFWLLFALLLALIQIGILQYAFESMGISRRYLFTLLVLSLLGSYVNIPIAKLPGQIIHSAEVVDFVGMRYVVPMVDRSEGTQIAINLGGAIVPFFLSCYLLVKHSLYGRALAATAMVTVAVHMMARPVPGVGIAVPMFIPPLMTAVVAVALSQRRAAPLAYIAGSMGTLIGADLLNLGKIRGLGAPVASIGGAGKFDGIFLTGIVAVLIASVLGARPPREADY